MKLIELKKFIDLRYKIAGESGSNVDDMDVCVLASGFGSVGGSSCAPIKFAMKGIDWDHNKLMIVPVNKLSLTSNNISISKENIIAMLDCMSSEDRIDIFGEYCASCGDKDPNCVCWNDE